jgi:hypothetical protein
MLTHDATLNSKAQLGLFDAIYETAGLVKSDIETIGDFSNSENLRDPSDPKVAIINGAKSGQLTHAKCDNNSSLLQTLIDEAEEGGAKPLRVQHMRGIKIVLDVIRSGVSFDEIIFWDDGRWLRELQSRNPNTDIKRRRSEIWSGLKELAKITGHPNLRHFLVERRGVVYGVKSLVPTNSIADTVDNLDTSASPKNNEMRIKVHDVKIESTNGAQFQLKPVTALDLLTIANRGGLCHRDGVALRSVAKILTSKSISLADFASQSDVERISVVQSVLGKPRPERLARQLMTVMNRTAVRFAQYEWPEFVIVPISRLKSADQATFAALVAELKDWSDATPEIRGTEITDYRALSQESKKQYKAAFLKLPNLLIQGGTFVPPECQISTLMQIEIVDEWINLFEAAMKPAIAVSKISAIWRIARDTLGPDHPGVEMVKAYVADHFPTHAISAETIKKLEFLTSDHIWKLLYDAPQILAQYQSKEGTSQQAILAKLRSAVLLQLKLDHHWLRARDLTEIQFARDFVFDGAVPVAIARSHREFSHLLKEATSPEFQQLFKLLCNARRRFGRKSDWLFPRYGNAPQSVSACMERFQNDVLEVTGLTRFRFQDLEDAIAFALLKETNNDIEITAESLGRQQFRTVSRRFDPVI